jgi:twitching motility protein PilT
MQVSQKDGMQTMDMALQNLVSRGLVSKEEAQSKSMNPNLFGGGLGVAAAGGQGR